MISIGADVSKDKSRICILYLYFYSILNQALPRISKLVKSHGNGGINW